MSKKEKHKELASHVDNNDEQIQVAAYFRWKERGEGHGNDCEDWYEAEKSVCE